jgi:hypothetical protein
VKENYDFLASQRKQSQIQTQPMSTKKGIYIIQKWQVNEIINKIIYI